MEYAANNEYTEYATNNDDRISNDLVSETASSIQIESSNNSGRPPADVWEEFNTINNGAGKHKGASCRYCNQKWSRGRAHEMKSHLALKCKGNVPREIRLKLFVDAYYDVKEAINKAKEKRANQSLIKWIVYSGISFSAFDNPYFEDYTKALNLGYNPPKRSALATSILDAEAANIIIKMDKELSKAKNLTLCIDSWCSPLKHSIYAFVIIASERKQYVYSLRDFSKFTHSAKFNAEKIIEVLESIGLKKFTAIVFDAESSMMVAK
ncbi:23362_t:CDS:2 [Dentiscutata erythropus]|uniref:23362_t:CDS:1 n=1 Tax=Dentiscutata erythropus TaxID=1348616 RepID=A0A9N9HJI7_9GLOM|nr:23362_t:CDS:2 [Dentiscutata erythropus]